MAVKRQLVFGVASVAALYAGVSNALGLGEVELQSALNQPLNATIQLQGGAGVSPEDIRVSLAGADAFANAGMERPFFLSDLRFIPVVQGDELIIRVESSKPVREPYLNFLVELRQPNGRVLREYTLLLDPPMYDSGAALSAQAPASVSAPEQPRRSGNTAAAGTNRPAPPPQPQLPDIVAQPGAATYNTVSGDTLWDIAAKTRPADSVSIRSNMLAIQALNPNAFIGGDIGRLRSGAELVLPSAEQLGVEQTTNGATVSSAEVAAQRPRASEAAPGSISRPGESVAASAAGNAPNNAERIAEPNARLRIEESTLESANNDNAELLDRLQLLENRFNVLLNELDARDRQIAALQAELEILRVAQASETETGAVTNAPVGTVGAGTAGTDVTSATGSDEPEPGAVEAEVVVPESQLNNDSLLSRWWPALLALLAALFGLLLWFRRRREDAQEPDTTTADGRELTVPEAAAATLAAEAATQTTMVRKAVEPRTTRPVDQLDGVELYITYGRFAEALVMLERAIEESPRRLDLRYKQLRVLAELGERGKFSKQEQSLLALGGDSGRIEEIKSRYPGLFSGRASDLVEQVGDVEPLLDEDPDQLPVPAQPDSTQDVAGNSESSELNLNDFTLDPDWDLIEGLTPGPAPRGDAPGEPEHMDDAAQDEMLRDGLRQLPDVEELDDDENLFPRKQDDQQR